MCKHADPHPDGALVLTTLHTRASLPAKESCAGRAISRMGGPPKEEDPMREVFSTGATVGAAVLAGLLADIPGPRASETRHFEIS